MKIYSNGKTIEIPIHGSSGSDQIPVGTVISFMGTKAPKDYLVCDGAQYAISDYPALASAFREQFGTSSYFGGDGESTFAVPDLRNLFLRGYHGDGEALSGDIGKVQAGTNIPWTETTSTSANFPKYSSKQEPVHFDKRTSARSNGVWYTTEADDAYKIAYSDFTARPVNMAVLYCVKAKESSQVENIYSTEETRIGTWIDGKPLYRKSYSFKFPDDHSAQWVTIPNTIIEDIEEITYLQGTARYATSQATVFPFPRSSGDTQVCEMAYRFGVGIITRSNTEYPSNQSATVTIKYTKTTDQATIELPAMQPAALVESGFPADDKEVNI